MRLREAITKTRLRMVLDTLLFSGMRYIELERFASNLMWFDTKNRAITLPAKAAKTGKSRTIHLTPSFSTDLEMYLREYKTLEVPCIRSMQDNLKRWTSLSVTPKTFRKTWESWLLAAGYQSMPIALSQGHSELISYGHFANLDPRLKSEMEQVRKFTEGWGT
jgi:integrase